MVLSTPQQPELAKEQAPKDLAVEVQDLTKVYVGSGKMPPKTALSHINLEIPRGSIFGLLGPNGAGKSTLINIMAGLVKKSSGQVFIEDFEIEDNARACRSAIGVVPQELNFDPFFTPRELLEQQAGLYGVPKKERRTEELLELVELADKADALARALSGGMRRRLMIAKAMVHNPPVLVLDEPTAGVDVELRHMLWDNVRAMNKAGTTVLLTTHYLEEAEQLCDHIAIINEGAVVVNDSKANLLKQIDSKQVTITLMRDIETLPAPIRKQGWERIGPRRLRLTYQPSKASIGQLLLTVQALGFAIEDLVTKETDLEDLFLQLTKTKLS